MVENPNDAAKTLNIDLDKIYKWTDTWLVEFNPLKTFSMTISRRLAHLFHPPLFLMEPKYKKQTHIYTSA